MIIKLDISGEEYLSLMEMLQSDANFYQKKVYSQPRHSRKTPIITVKASKSDGQRSEFDALPHHCITLEVDQCFNSEDEGGGFTKTPLSLLEKVFDAVDLFPSDEEGSE